MSDVMIEAQSLGKRYGNTVALKSASFELRRGEILGFLGPNGAGKSTAMKILTCFIAPTTGTATVAGCDIWKDPMGVRRSIGYLPENNPLYKEMLVLEYLEWVASMRGLRRDVANKRILKVIEEVRLEEVVAKSINQLSKGYRQRVGLAQALLHEPPILILDEPMTGLDPNQARDIRKLIKDISKERSIILSTHNLAEVAMTCTRVLIVDRGAIVADDTPEALAQSEARKYRVVYKRGELSPSSIFGSVRGVDQVRDVTKGENGEIEVEILPATDEDLRAEIYQAAVKSGAVLLELTMFGRSLETVFQKLTTRDEVVLLREVGLGDEDEEEEEETSEDEEEESEEEEDTSEEESEEEEEDTSSEEESEEEEESSDEEEEEESSDDEEEESSDDEEEESSDDEEEEEEESSSDEEEEEEQPQKKGKK